MKKKVDYKDFDLRNIKLGKKEVHIKFFDLGQKNDIVTVDSDSQPHIDLIGALAKLNEVFCRAIGLHSGWDFARENNRKNEEALKLAIIEYKSEISRCHVTEFTCVGTDDDPAVKIKASLKCETGTISGITSTPIQHFGEEFLSDIDLASIIEEVRKEVWCFLYSDKRGNDLFNQEVKDEEHVSGLNNKAV